MKRRDALRSLSMAGGASLLSAKDPLTHALAPDMAARFVHPGFAQAIAGTAPIKIRDIKTILTSPNNIRLVVVKVETTEPGLGATVDMKLLTMIGEVTEPGRKNVYRRPDGSLTHW